MAFCSRLLRIKPHFNHLNFSSIAKLNSRTPLIHKQKIKTALSLLQSKNKNPAEKLLYLALSDAVSKFPQNASTSDVIPSFLRELKTKPSLLCSFLDELKSRPELKKERYFCNFITLYTNAGMYDEALQTFRDMPEIGVSHSADSLSALFHGVLRDRGYPSYGLLLKFSDFLMNVGVQPDLDTCNLVLKLYIRWGYHDMRDRISEFLNFMNMNGCKPDDTTDSIILYGLYKETPENTLELLNLMEKCQLSVKLYNHWIATLCDLGRISEAKGLFEEMSSRGFKPNADTYQHLFRACGVAGDVKKMKSLINDMSENNVECDRYCYEALVQSLCKMGGFATALQACKDCMSKDWFVSVFFKDLSTLKILVNGLVFDSKYEELEKFVDKMEKSGLRPGRDIYNFIIGSLCEEMRIYKALAVYEKMKLRGIIPNADTYNQLIPALDRYGNNMGAQIIKLYDSMCDIGVDHELYWTCLFIIFKETLQADMSDMWKELDIRCKNFLETIQNLVKKDPNAQEPVVLEADMKGVFLKIEDLQKKIRERYLEFKADPECVNIALCLSSFGVCYNLGLVLF